MKPFVAIDGVLDYLFFINFRCISVENCAQTEILVCSFEVVTPSGAWKNEGPLVSNCHTMYHGPPPPRQESRWGATRGTVITVKASGGMDTGNITERLLARSCAAHRHARATMQGAEGPCEAEHAPA